MEDTERSKKDNGAAPASDASVSEQAAAEESGAGEHIKSAAGGVGRTLSTFVSDARRFFQEELWDRDVGTLPRMKRFLFSLCRVSTIVVKGFIADNCGLQASALTYITLMSMIPVLALMFSFTKGIGMQNRIIEVIGLEKHEVTETVDGEKVVDIHFSIPAPDSEDDEAKEQAGEVPEPNTPESRKESMRLRSLPEPLQKAVITIFTYVENTKFGTLGLVGSLLLFWAVVKAISKLEHTFNAIWGIKESRPLFRRITEYIFLIIMIPMVFLVATSVNAAMSSQEVVDRIREFVGPLAWLYRRLIRLSGFVLIGLAFSFLYGFMPNTKVKLFPALVAGFVAGLLWFLTQWAYITFQIGVTKYNAIYGTFAVVPFFLAWLYANWMLVLFGAEVSFAVQNHRTYILESSSSSASPAVLSLLGLVLTYEACKAFYEGRSAWSPVDYAREHAIPARMLGAVTSGLVDAGVLVRVAGDGERYVPGKDLSRLTVEDVEEAFRGHNKQFSQKFVKLLPERLGDEFLSQYETFRRNLSDISFRDALEAQTA
jgi:membrane protein